MMTTDRSAATGSTFKRCACRDKAGKLLSRCPRLRRPTGGWNSSHGNWGFQIELPPTSDGRRRQARRTGFADQAAAQAMLDHVRDLLAIAEDDDGARVQAADAIAAALKSRSALPTVEQMTARLLGGPNTRDRIPTVAEWLREWLDTKTELAPGTRRSYQGHITNHLTPHLGWVRLDKLAVGHVQAMFEAIEEENDHIRQSRNSDDEKVRTSVRGRRVTGLATKHRIRATLRSALSTAVARPDLPLQFNVGSHVALESCPRVKPTVWTADRLARWKQTGEVPSAVMVWTPEQTADFLRRAKQDRLYPLFHLIAMKGTRRGEAVGLPWDAVRLQDRQVDIYTQVVQLGWEVITSTPKSAAGQRTITLDTNTARILKEWRATQAAEKLAAGPEWVEMGLVFTHPDGAGLHPAWVSSLFHRIADEAGLPPIGLHGLRHGAATMGLAAGVDVKVVSTELGHASTHFTQDTYQSVLPEVAAAAAEATAAMVPLEDKERRLRSV